MGEMVAYQTYKDMDERRLKAEKEIEQLLKEKEWLIQELSYRTAKDRLKVDGEMQQALEE